jgi:azurin
MANINRYHPFLEMLDTVVVFDDFTGDQSDITALDTITDTGTALVGDAVNGVIVLTPSDGTVADNDECYLSTPNELFKFGTSRNIYGRFKFQYSAVVAADPNVAVGFMNAPGTSAISDNGGVKVSGDTLAVEKKDGETYFRATSASSGASTTTLSNKAIAAATDYVVEIEANDWDGVSMQVTYKVDGDYLRDTSNNIIKHTVAISGSEEMAMFAGIKLGAATNNDTLSLDYWYGSQTRV